jgi:hypothetical protein
MEPLLITSSFLFGKEFMSQTITTSTKSILGGVTSILEDEDFIFKKILKDYDLTSKVEVINSYINEVTHDEHLFEKESIKLAIKNLINILQKISEEIKLIELHIKEHKKIWFHRFRTPEYKTLLINLETHIRILIERFDLLIKIKN